MLFVSSLTFSLWFRQQFLIWEQGSCSWLLVRVFFYQPGYDAISNTYSFRWNRINDVDHYFTIREFSPKFCDILLAKSNTKEGSKIDFTSNF